MKKILSITACLLLILSACNKDKKFNKSLDGTWLTTSVDGVPVTMADNPVQYQFSKSDKTGGEVKVSYFSNHNLVDEYTGTYKVSNDGKTLTIHADATPGFNADPGSKIHQVNSVSDKTDKKFTMRGNLEARRGFVYEAVYVLEKQ